MTNTWEQVGTVEILKPRTYPIDPRPVGHVLRTEVVVEPGIYPVYRKYDAYVWVMSGRINERNAKMGDGLFEFNNGDKPTGLIVKFPSKTFGAEQFREFLANPICQPGPAQRLKFTLHPDVTMELAESCP